MNDVAVRANAASYLVDALNVSGGLTELLPIADEEIARLPRHLPRDEWLWGFNHQTLIRIGCRGSRRCAFESSRPSARCLRGHIPHRVTGNSRRAP